MYSINEYELSVIDHDVYIFHETKAAKISNTQVKLILEHLKSKPKLEISDEELIQLAQQHNINLDVLKKLLMDQLNIIRPLFDRKFSSIYINCDDSLISQLVSDSLRAQYKVVNVLDQVTQYPDNALIFFYRNNYTSSDFNELFSSLSKNNYIVTAGLIGKLLIIDNIYFIKSGLPTHTSNLHQLLNYLENGLESAKDNWLMFYRSLMRANIKKFPNPSINPCERGFAAYSIYKFISQFTDFWSTPLTTDQLNWFWHVDLKKSTICKEVSIHSPFSEFDMNLNLNNINFKKELVD